MARHLTVEPDEDFCTSALKDILFGHFQPETADAVQTSKEGFSYVCPGHKLNRKGTAKGILRGGNLSVFYGLRGTPYDIPAEGTILFIEDVGERPHAVERMIYNLKLGGILERLSGLIIGQFTEYEEKPLAGKRPLRRHCRPRERVFLPRLLRLSGGARHHEPAHDQRRGSHSGNR